MKLLCLHSDFIEFEPVSRAVKQAEEGGKEKKRKEECLVVFAAVEKADEADWKEKAAGAVSEIENITGQIKVRGVVLYPFVHLTASPASPTLALSALKEVEAQLKAKGYDVLRAPFGWYKRFTLSCKGHPLAEWSREIKPGAAPRVFRASHGEPDVKAEKKEERVHIGLGKQLDFFTQSEYAPAMPLFPPKGLTVRRLLVDYVRSVNRDLGYEEILTPLLYKTSLWRESGHLETYADRMYVFEKDGEEYGLKPMNCPGHILLFKRKAWSYKDLPVRYSELAPLFRYEQSGEVTGLLRVRSLTQDDGHAFVREDQVLDEVRGLIRAVKKMIEVFGFSGFRVALSTRGEGSGFIGRPELWDKATAALRQALEAEGVPFEEKSGEAAFYGPKIDVDIKDASGSFWQCSTIQVDFTLPERFGLKYDDGRGGKARPVMIHRTILGALERFFGVLLECFKGRLPPWLSPVQAVVLTVSDKQADYARSVAAELEKAGLRVRADASAETLSKKIVEAHAEKIPYMLVVGEKEAANRTVTVRDWNDKQKKDARLEDFLKHALAETGDKKTAPCFCA